MSALTPLPGCLGVPPGAGAHGTGLVVRRQRSPLPKLLHRQPRKVTVPVIQQLPTRHGSILPAAPNYASALSDQPVEECRSEQLGQQDQQYDQSDDGEHDGAVLPHDTPTWPIDSSKSFHGLLHELRWGCRDLGGTPRWWNSPVWVSAERGRRRSGRSGRRGTGSRWRREWLHCLQHDTPNCDSALTSRCAWPPARSRRLAPPSL
jgi:hypothetical protein